MNKSTYDHELQRLESQSNHLIKQLSSNPLNSEIVKEFENVGKEIDQLYELKQKQEESHIGVAYIESPYPIIMHGEKDEFEVLWNPLEVKKLKSVSFPTNDDSVIKVKLKTRYSGSGQHISKATIPGITGMKKWGNEYEPIPDFVIITGANGAGKFQLLYYISTILCCVDNEKVFFAESDFKL